MKIALILLFIFIIIPFRAESQVVILEDMKLDKCLIHSVCAFYIPKDDINRKAARRAGFIHDKVVVRINELETKKFKYKLCTNGTDAIPLYWKSFEERLSDAETVTVTGRKFRSTIVGNLHIDQVKARKVMEDIMDISSFCPKN